MAEFKINDQTLVNSLQQEEIKDVICTEKKALIAELKKKMGTELPEDFNLESCKGFEYPLDEKSLTLLKSLLQDGHEEIDYSQEAQLNELWITLIEKSIICLRFFDTREPFLKNSDKKPIAYNIKDLSDYQKQYSEFEAVLYGSSPYYRDHVFHSVRTWLIGVFCLLTTEINDEKESLINKIKLDGLSEKEDFSDDINFFEKLSIWTIASLCHDMGYPLEKSREVLSTTQKMMKNFIPNPNIWDNFAFNGIEDTINDYVVKFLSTKMKKKSENSYLGRVQPKYYLKYTKSLEHFNHGVISSVILYKMMLYFMESDFNLNDDYEYSKEAARQFYIRREILRSMASHTCSDIYNIHLTTFSSMLFICDELQEWGRKHWNDLYAGADENSINLSIEKFSFNEIICKEEIELKNNDKKQIIKEYIKRFLERQYEYYKIIFRDAQNTGKRQFHFRKTVDVKLQTGLPKQISFSIIYELNTESADAFTIDISSFINEDDKEILDFLSKNKNASDYKNEISINYPEK